MKLADLNLTRELTGGYILTRQDARKVCKILPPEDYVRERIEFEDDPCGFHKNHFWALQLTRHQNKNVWWLWRSGSCCLFRQCQNKQK